MDPQRRWSSMMLCILIVSSCVLSVTAQDASGATANTLAEAPNNKKTSKTFLHVGTLVAGLVVVVGLVWCATRRRYDHSTARPQYQAPTVVVTAPPPPPPAPVAYASAPMASAPAPVPPPVPVAVPAPPPPTPAYAPTVAYVPTAAYAQAPAYAPAYAPAVHHHHHNNGGNGGGGGMSTGGAAAAGAVAGFAGGMLVQGLINRSQNHGSSGQDEHVHVHYHDSGYSQPTYQEHVHYHTSNDYYDYDGGGDGGDGGFAGDF